MTETMTLNMGVFEAISSDEMLAVDGGISWNDVGLYVSGAAGGCLGAKAGAALGAKIGTACAPGVGTVAGTIIGGAVGIIVYSLWD